MIELHGRKYFQVVLDSLGVDKSKIHIVIYKLLLFPGKRTMRVRVRVSR